MSDPKPRTWTVSTADVMRGLAYHPPMPGWHSHGQHLIPSDGCHPCRELKRRQAEAPPSQSPPDVASGG